MFEKGWRLPTTEGSGPKYGEPTRYRKGLRRVAHHFDVLGDFSAATSEYLQESDISQKLRSWLEFGLRYHEVGLSKCMTEFEIPNDAEEVFRAPVRAGGANSANGDGARTSGKPECGDVLAIVGARTAREVVEFDCFLIVEGDGHDEENVRVGTIDPVTGFISLKDGFLTGQTRKQTADQVCPPTYLNHQT